MWTWCFNFPEDWFVFVLSMSLAVHGGLRCLWGFCGLVPRLEISIPLSVQSLRSHPVLKHMLAKQNLTAFKFPKTAMPTYSHRQRKAYTSVSNPIDRRAYLINKSARHVDFQERKQPKTQRLLVGTTTKDRQTSGTTKPPSFHSCFGVNKSRSSWDPPATHSNAFLGFITSCLCWFCWKTCLRENRTPYTARKKEGVPRLND